MSRPPPLATTPLPSIPYSSLTFSSAMEETTPFRVDMDGKESPHSEQQQQPPPPDVAKSCEELRRIQALVQNDDETRAIIDGFASSIERLQKAIGRSRNLQTAIDYYLEFSEHLLSGNESIVSANSILDLNVPHRKDDLIRLTVKIRHCVENFEDNMKSVKKCYANINRFAFEEVPETNCSAEVQSDLLAQIRWTAAQATKFIDQSVKHGETTLRAINDFNKENNVYHFGYRTVLHAILLLVGVGIVAANIITKGLQAFETFIITIGFVLYIILEHSWWAYTNHKITTAKKGIEKQMNKMKAVEDTLKDFTSHSNGQKQ